MFERNIKVEEIKSILINPTILNYYEEDKPYPSYLLLGWQNDRPLHLVVALNKENKETIIITAYEPTLEEWNDSFNIRK